MTHTPKIESSEYADLNSVLRWFIALRWFACVGVLLTLLAADYFLHPNRSYTTLYVLNFLLFAVNGGFHLYYAKKRVQQFSRQEMGWFFHAQVCTDYLFLFLHVYYTGFLENPCVYFFAFHVMLTSFIFSPRVVYGYLAALIILFWGTAAAQTQGLLDYHPLGLIRDRQVYSDTLVLRLGGVSATLVITGYLITRIKGRIEERGKIVEVELDKYKSLDKLKSNFILQVTHELRGPVAAVKGYHEMMLKGITGDLTEKTKRAVDRADVRTRNLLNIIDEMIDYAYIKSNDDVKVDLSPIALKQAIERSLEIFQGQAEEKAIVLSSSCPGDLMLSANIDLLDIIFANLITNAIRYSREPSTVWITASQDNGMAHIQVKDRGMGIEPDQLTMIFEEFYRTRRAREIEQDGTGLGLSIVKKVVDALGGRIQVYSERGKGSNFHIYLPSAAAAKGVENVQKQSADN